MQLYARKVNDYNNVYGICIQLSSDGIHNNIVIPDFAGGRRSIRNPKWTVIIYEDGTDNVIGERELTHEEIITLNDTVDFLADNLGKLHEQYSLFNAGEWQEL